MLAGFAEIEFTPERGYMPGEMVGYLADGTIGGLYANAAAFTNGDDSAILVSMDVLSFHKEYADDIRKRIADATGVPKKNVLVAAIHTHTATSLEYQVWLCPPDPVTAANTADKTVEAAIKAWNSRSEAKLGVEKTYETRFSYCRDFYIDNGEIRMNPARFSDRLVKPAGPVDHSVNVMRVDDAEGNIKCFIVNYANHPDCHTKRDKFSADYPGYMRRALKRKYGDDVVVLYFNGTAGDINCLDFKGGRHLAYYGGTKNAPEAIGAGLCSTVVDISTRIEAEDDEPKLRAISRNVVLDRRYKTQADYEWAKKIAEDMASHKIRDQAFATEYLEPDDNVQPTIDFEIHTLRLGPWAIVGLPSEIFTDVGRRIKRASPFDHTVIFELANGTHGYISTRTLHNSTAYEAKVSKYNACTAADSADRIVEAAVAQLRELYAMED